LILICIPAAASAFDPALSGERQLGQSYSFTVRNVTALDQSKDGSDVTYDWSVYDYRFIDEGYTYWSVNWGQWFRQDADPGKKYLVVWVRSQMSGNTSWYGWGPDRFRVWVWGNTTIDPEPIPLQDLQIKYGSEKYRPVVISELQELNGRLDKKLLTREWYGWKDEIELNRQEPGASAAWDGMILYQIPAEATEDDIRVLGWSWYGYGVWYLTEHDDLIQVKSFEGSDMRVSPTIQEPAKKEIRGRSSQIKTSRENLTKRGVRIR
jgi:hypothetical protein